jgi:hypothetical protein
VLAGRLGHELLHPEAEGAHRPADHEGELVAAREGQLAERHAEPEAGVGALELVAGLLRLARRLEQRADVDAHERRGTSPKYDSAE